MLRESHETPLVAPWVEKRTCSRRVRAGVFGGSRGLPQVSRIALPGLFACLSGSDICQNLALAYVESPSAENRVAIDVLIVTCLSCCILSAPPVVITLPRVKQIPT